MKTNLLFTASLVIFAGIVSVLSATPLPPGPQIVPVDGGLSLLVAACAGVGAKKLYDYRKSKKADN